MAHCPHYFKSHLHEACPGQFKIAPYHTLPRHWLGILYSTPPALKCELLEEMDGVRLLTVGLPV